MPHIPLMIDVWKVIPCKIQNGIKTEKCHDHKAVENKFIYFIFYHRALNLSRDVLSRFLLIVTAIWPWASVTSSVMKRPFDSRNVRLRIIPSFSIRVETQPVSLLSNIWISRILPVSCSMLVKLQYWEQNPGVSLRPSPEMAGNEMSRCRGI